MIPFTIAPLLLESFRRELRALGFEPAEPRIVERQLQRQGLRQTIARIGRWLAGRSPEVLPGHTKPETSVATFP